MKAVIEGASMSVASLSVSKLQRAKPVEATATGGKLGCSVKARAFNRQTAAS